MKLLKKAAVFVVMVSAISVWAQGPALVLAVENKEPVNSSFVVAVLPFDVSGQELKDVGPEVTLLVNTYLSDKEGINLVERAQLDKAISEMGVGLSGVVSPETAAKIGQVVGAKILITGRVFAIQNELFLVAKIIGTETSQVFGESVSLPLNNPYKDAAKQLSDQIAATVLTKGEALVSQKKEKIDSLEDLKYLVEGKDNLPVIGVTIQERHVGQPAIDPAAETELNLALSTLGFPLVDPATSTQQPDIDIQGEAFSEFGMRNGNLVSCKGRVEVKVLERSTGKIIAVDRQADVAVDLSEQIAGKAAIQKAAHEVAVRIIPKIIKAMPNSKVFVSK